MLLILTLTKTVGALPIEALERMDSELAGLGFKKEVRIVVKPGAEYSVTYDGPNLSKEEIERTAAPIAQQYGFTFSIEVEESIRFP